MVELTQEELSEINGGIGPAGIVAGLLGFGSGAVIGFAVAAGIIYIASKNL